MEQSHLRPYKILFLTADVGHGHLSIHRAIYNKFETMLTDSTKFSISELEITKELNPIKKALSFGAYKFCVEWFPHIYSIFYRFFNYMSTEFIINQHRKLLSYRLIDKIVTEAPDMIISTHFSGTAFASILKRDGQLNPETLFVTFLTDFVTGNAYNFEGILIVPHPRLKQIMENSFNRKPGTTEIIPGLLPRHEFTQQFSHYQMKVVVQNEIFSETGITYDHQSPMFLVSGGGEGLRLNRFINFLPKWHPSSPVVVPIITGKNSKLLSKIRKLCDKGLHSNLTIIPLGYKTNMHQYMKAADIVISKPGGATLAETMTLGLPHMVQDYILGQEKDNLDFLTSMGILYELKDYEKLNDIPSILKIASNIMKTQKLEFPIDQSIIEELPKLFNKILSNSKNDRIKL